MMPLFTGHAPRPGDAEFGYEDMGFEPHPRAATWTGAAPAARLADFSVTIVGAGFSGIAAAVQLDRLGIRYQIVERQADIGGTWQLNDYPEARVDISSFLYQYKFEKNYPWKSYFATRAELKEYFDHIVDKYRHPPADPARHDRHSRRVARGRPEMGSPAARSCGRHAERSQ